jgi:hypothetical protein
VRDGGRGRGGAGEGGRGREREGGGRGSEGEGEGIGRKQRAGAGPNKFPRLGAVVSDKVIEHSRLLNSAAGTRAGLPEAVVVRCWPSS